MPGDQVIAVDTPSRSCNATIGRGLFPRLGELARAALGPAPKKAAIIADNNVPAALLSAADVSLSRAGFFIARIGLDATEERKSIKTLEGVLAFLASMKLERTEPVIAIGGGIIGDLVGFAASIHRRGCPVIQCPTTLLAMVDASIGGKTGVNLAIHASESGSGGKGSGGSGGGTLLKNAVGSFHQPHAVIASLDALDSLPPRQFAAGLAECVKHALLGVGGGGPFGEPDLFNWMESNSPNLSQSSGRGARSPSAGVREGGEGVWPSLISRNIAIKAKVIATDEHEQSASPASPASPGHPGPPGRALLNLGHTFAHAIETLQGLTFDTAEGRTTSPLLHGEAVALGLVAATHASAALNLCDPSLPARVKALLTALHLPTRATGLPAPDTILARMAHDKKTTGGSLRLILPTTHAPHTPHAPHAATILHDPPTPIVLDAIRAMGA